METQSGCPRNSSRGGSTSGDPFREIHLGILPMPKPPKHQFSPEPSDCVQKRPSIDVAVPLGGQQVRTPSKCRPSMTSIWCLFEGWEGPCSVHPGHPTRNPGAFPTMTMMKCPLVVPRPLQELAGFHHRQGHIYWFIPGQDAENLFN